ncbi:NF038122 family metalloprotease [bacterium]|nr:NF038122 family metalloprotease [bacterium]
MNRFALGLIVLLVGWVSACHGQMTIRTSNGANSIANQTFQRAANTWGAEFHDNITVFLEFGFVTLDQRTVSSATSGRDSFLYGDFRDAVGNDVSTTDDTRFFNGLAEGSSFSIYTNQTSEAPGANHELSYVDNDGGLNNTTVSLSTANAKALGLRDSHSSTVDGFINFNSLYEWENFTACGGLKTNPGHYGIPWLTGKDNCEAPRGCGCGLRRSSLGCGTSACRSTSIECTKLKGIKGWFKKSDCQCDSCHPAESTVVEYVQER